MTAIMEYGISIGLTAFSIVQESWWLPRSKRIGWKPHPLRLPQLTGGMSVLVDCNEATWTSRRGHIGRSGPILTCRRLSDLNRRALPALSVLPPATAQQTR
jgi:acyl-homoserine lactone synthase